MAAGTQIIGSTAKFRDGLMFRSVPTLTHRHVALPVGEYTGTLRQPIMSVDVKRPVKINMIKINLGGAADGGRRKKDPSGRIWLPGHDHYPSVALRATSQSSLSKGGQDGSHPPNEFISVSHSEGHRPGHLRPTRGAGTEGHRSASTPR